MSVGFGKKENPKTADPVSSAAQSLANFNCFFNFAPRFATEGKFKREEVGGWLHDCAIPWRANQMGA